NFRIGGPSPSTWRTAGTGCPGAMLYRGGNGTSKPQPNNRASSLRSEKSVNLPHMAHPHPGGLAKLLHHVHRQPLTLPQERCVKKCRGECGGETAKREQAEPSSPLPRLRRLGRAGGLARHGSRRLRGFFVDGGAGRRDDATDTVTGWLFRSRGSEP